MTDQQRVTPESIRPEQLLDALLNVYYPANLPVFIHGSPGSGKSDIVRASAKAYGAELYDVRLSLLDSVDMRGVPVPDLKNNVVNWFPPSFWPRQNGKIDEPTILFLDEINTALPPVQAASYQLIYDRKIGEYDLPSQCRIVCAGNLSTDRAIAHRMGTALNSRMAHVELLVDVAQWVTWARQKKLDQRIISFIELRPELLFVFGDKEKDSQRAFPCPRTWEFLSSALATGNIKTDAVSNTIVASIIGPDAASEFVPYLNIADQCDSPTAILADPQGARIPRESSVAYAIMTAIAKLVTVDTFENALIYGARLGDNAKLGNAVEFTAAMIRESVKRDESLADTEVYATWISEHSDVEF